MNENNSSLIMYGYKSIYSQPANNWAKYPEKGSVDAGYHETFFSISLPGELGYEPRNIQENLKLEAFHPLRHAMPLNFCHPSLSFYEENNETLRKPVIEWLTVLYAHKMGLNRMLTQDECMTIIQDNELTYQNIWFVNEEIKDQTYPIMFDKNGFPLNPVPGMERCNILGYGFYFSLGPNYAVDLTLSLYENNTMYVFVAHGKGDAPNVLRIVGGMIDKDTGKVFNTLLKEFREETGIKLKYDECKEECEYICGSITDEARATRHAWTKTSYFDISFDSKNHLADMIESISEIEHKNEITRCYLIDIRYLYINFLCEDGNQKFFSGHDSLIKKLIKYRQENDRNVDFYQLLQESNCKSKIDITQYNEMRDEINLLKSNKSNEERLLQLQFEFKNYEEKLNKEFETEREQYCFDIGIISDLVKRKQEKANWNEYDDDEEN